MMTYIALVICAGLLALHVAATTGPCTQQLLDTGTSSNLAANIDPDSPATACSMAVCTSTELGGCASAAKENLILVMSDEFNKDGRGLAVYQNDPLWTAENLYYQPTSDMEVYTAQQVATGGELPEVQGSINDWTVLDHRPLESVEP